MVTTRHLCKTKTHIYGYISTQAQAGTLQPLQNAFSLLASPELNGMSLRLMIDRVRIKKYPGKGTPG